jgi:UDP-glucose 4-epimerase
MKKILITGSKGYIARNIAARLKNCDLFLVDRSMLDLENNKEVDAFFENRFFDIVINTAIKGGTRLQPDQPEFVFKNCLIHFNLLRNNKMYGKYISLGSGAEFDRLNDITDINEKKSLPIDPYGMSKILIANTGKEYEKFYNLRIFNIFCEDELPTRMIKSNTLRYIKKEDIIIHQDKLMDFMYIDDFIKILNFYIDNDKCPKEINCTYKKKYLLSDIANIINNLSNYKVNIQIQCAQVAKSYIGKYELDKLNIEFGSLEMGIKLCYDYYLRNGQ